MDPAILELVGSIDFDPDEITRRYAQERDRRLRPEGNAQYVEVKAEFSHYLDDPYVQPGFVRDPLHDTVEVVVIGGGFGGVLCGARLRQAGIQHIRMIEKGGDFGGTWYWNRYPGIRCDTESYVYFPMLEELGYVPREKYSAGSEILEHTRRIARHFRLYDDVCFQTIVTELRWDDDSGCWIVATDRGDRIRARFVAMANGPLNKPKLPGIPGIDTFRGHTFHTSRWDFDYTGGDETGNLTRLCDKRVGIIGTAATAVQCIPHLGASAKQLHVFQRTPAAVDVRANRPTDPDWVASLRPGWQKRRSDNFNRVISGIPQDVDLVNDGFTAVGRLLDPTGSWAQGIIGRALTADEGEFLTEILDDKKMIEIRARIDSVVRDPKTAALLKPWHRRWCKRPLFSDDYLPTFNRPNVTLVDVAAPVEQRLTETSMIVDGREYELDCLIFATGFEVGTLYTRRAGYDVIGRNGLKLSEHWKNGMRTFHGFHSRGFPNCMFIGFGQNAVATNFVFILDEQAKHVAYTISEARKRGAKRFEASAGAVERYVEEVQPLSFSKQKFWVECTPSYFNGEGTSDNPNGFFANLHPLGAVGFYAMLEACRDTGELEGLELSA